MKDTSLIVFEEKGFPSVKIYETRFEIRAIDYWEFRSFKYAEIKELKYFCPNNNWFNRLYISMSIAGRMFSKNDQWILKIVKSDKDVWEYKTSSKPNTEFRKALKIINEKVEVSSN